MTLAEVHEATELIQQATDAEDANIIFGIVQDPNMKDEVRITVLATGFDQRPHVPVPARTIMASSTRPADGTGGTGGTATQTAPEPTTQRQPADNDVDIPAFLRRR